MNFNDDAFKRITQHSAQQHNLLKELQVMQIKIPRIEIQSFQIPEPWITATLRENQKKLSSLISKDTFEHFKATSEKWKNTFESLMFPTLEKIKEGCDRGN